ITLDNRSSTHGWPGGISKRFEVEGWSAATVNGRSHADIRNGLSENILGRPHALVATVEDK
ncbi:MAG: transketolase, partial [Planctomycetales bacterium]